MRRNAITDLERGPYEDSGLSVPAVWQSAEVSFLRQEMGGVACGVTEETIEEETTRRRQVVIAAIESFRESLGDLSPAVDTLEIEILIEILVNQSRSLLNITAEQELDIRHSETAFYFNESFFAIKDALVSFEMALRSTHLTKEQLKNDIKGFIAMIEVNALGLTKPL